MHLTSTTTTFKLTLPSFLFLLVSFFRVVVSVHGQSIFSGTSSSVNSTSSRSSSSSIPPTASSSAAYPSLSGYSTCVTNCLQVAVSNRGCPSIIQTNCYCNSSNVAAFERDLISCADSGCPNELANAESLAKAFCAVGNSSTSISFPPITSSSSSHSSSLPLLSSTRSSSTSSSSSSPTQSSNDAVGARGERRGITSLLFGVCISLASVLIGTFSV